MCLAILAVPSVASAQEYGESHGPLVVSQSLELAGEGFSSGSAVKVELRNRGTEEVSDFGSLITDAAGRLEGSISLPSGLTAGDYTLTATGVTPEGATRVLSADLRIPGVGPEPAPVEPLDGLPRWLLILLPALGLLLVAGATWCCVVARRRRAGEQPSGAEALPDNTVGRP